MSFEITSPMKRANVEVAPVTNKGAHTFTPAERKAKSRASKGRRSVAKTEQGWQVLDQCPQKEKAQHQAFAHMAKHRERR